MLLITAVAIAGVWVAYRLGSPILNRPLGQIFSKAA
ncbi:hypothetical protein SEA_PUPPER_180 [Gordonia phage Pupper]|uniref:Uncharacterized protein n=1 Tax=Gordonia phage Pupper TaxID=2571249 RepID=A0A4Y6EIV9_9CAUD|nr:hypothetical protein KHQ83_gp097 [Gordonia phage Pupper]QDF18666.1 hypothetical protein SEA_PUPPER_180 [Gordonia phage Pupper]QDF18898.1 hypothetical protein SEA_SCENTAE_179 [Gordonia phage SCentae]